jgi:ribonuclease VapC
MVIDTSAVIAMLFGEPEWSRLAEAIELDPTRLISSVSIFEASIVTFARLGEDGIDDLDLLLTRIQADSIGFRPAELAVAREAYFRFGKGRHPAALNFGDCFSYALAVSTNQPLLFKGDDFSKTDLAIVPY